MPIDYDYEQQVMIEHLRRTGSLAGAPSPTRERLERERRAAAGLALKADADEPRDAEPAEPDAREGVREDVREDAGEDASAETNASEETGGASAAEGAGSEAHDAGDSPLADAGRDEEPRQSGPQASGQRTSEPEPSAKEPARADSGKIAIPRAAHYMALDTYDYRRCPVGFAELAEEIFDAPTRSDALLAYFVRAALVCGDKMPEDIDENVVRIVRRGMGMDDSAGSAIEEIRHLAEVCSDLSRQLRECRVMLAWLAYERLGLAQLAPEKLDGMCVGSPFRDGRHDLSDALELVRDETAQLFSAYERRNGRVAGHKPL